MEVMERDERKRPRARRSFTAEFKAEIVQLCQQGRAPAKSRSVPIARTCLSLESGCGHLGSSRAALGCRSASGAGEEAFGDGSDRLALDLGL